MKNQFTAKDANKLAMENNYSHRVVDEILERIKEKALEGEFEIEIGKYGFGDISYCSNGLTENQEKIVDELDKLGFKTEMVVEKLLPLYPYNIYLHITW